LGIELKQLLMRISALSTDSSEYLGKIAILFRIHENSSAFRNTFWRTIVISFRDLTLQMTTRHGYSLGHQGSGPGQQTGRSDLIILEKNNGQRIPPVILEIYTPTGRCIVCPGRALSARNGTR
jgi:hypothetical protein